MQTTPFIGLKKPESNEYVSVTDLNDNSDTIDEAVNARVDATGGDISETVIETLETVEDKYPIPTAGESVKRFFGKVLTFLRNIRPLTGDTTLYVSTTGSDILGDGTSGNPFKTIQHAIDILPKDLNGYNATITVSAGTYNEDVIIRSFHGSTLRLESDTKNTAVGTCYAKSILVASCGSGYVVVNGFNLTTTSRPAIQVLGCYNVHINYCQSTVVATSQDGIDVFESFCSINYCRMANRYAAASFSNSRGASANWLTGSTGNNIGLAHTNGAMVASIGDQPIGTAIRFQGSAGVVFYENGTQIRGITNAGLSCTWGTISGGYVRHGNMVGTAMVTIQCAVNLSISLSAGITYIMAGFPPCPGISVAVSVHDQADFYFCQLNPDGNLVFQTNKTITAGNYFLFNCTYLTLT